MSATRAREPAWRDVSAWFETIDAIIRGLGHALNNRALALSATIESLDPKRPIGTTLSAGLTREAERLTEQLRQLRALPFAVASEPMPLLLPDVLAAAIQLHRTHASLGNVPVYLEGTASAPPVLAPESSLVHATLVLLTALKAHASPGGVVRIGCDGSPDAVVITFQSQRDPADVDQSAPGAALVQAVSLAAALLSSAQIEIEQEIGPESAIVTWRLPSLKAMRKRLREQAAVR
ncbi:MAG: hypothetical protein V4813_12840 [Gemmatimonadota bacterium]